ncbi:MAG: maltose acetyltransferase [Bermanella sp.]|nr:maltose acetyltransferase [Bermanella sp.]
MNEQLTEHDKMLGGEWFNPTDQDLRLRREQARLACAKYNAHPSKGNLRHVTRLLKTKPKQMVIEPGFQCDYGSNICVGENFFANFNCVLLDSGLITIGDNVLLGPDVHIYTVDHPRDAVQRRQGLCQAQPVVIGDDVWIGAGVKILPGVSIGEGAIIGANTLVKRDVTAFSRYMGDAQ